MMLIKAFFYALSTMMACLFLPGAALFPRLLFSPGTLPLVVPISLVVIGSLFEASLFFHVQTPLVLHGASLLMLFALAGQVYFLKLYSKNTWQKSDVYFLLLSLAIVLPLFWIGLFNSFYTNDEIYSWGYWALQHYNNQTIDYSLTQVPYPQLFSIYIAYVFRFFANVEIQGVVKASLCVFPWVLTSLLYYSSPKSQRFLPWFLVILFFCIFPRPLYSFYTLAYADSMMLACLLAAFISYQFYTIERKSIWLITGVLCSVAAIFTKQPSLIWVGITLPAFLIQDSLLRRMRKESFWHAIDLRLLCSILVILGASLYWMFFPGFGFWHNTNVLDVSWRNRDIAQQIAFWCHEHLSPFTNGNLLLVFLLCGIMATQIQKRLIPFFYFFTLPQLLMWIFVANYQLRLGLPVMVSLAYILIRADYLSPYFDRYLLIGKKIPALFNLKKIAIFLASLSVLSSTALFYYYRSDFTFARYPFEGGRTTLNAFFGKTGDVIYKAYYNNPHVHLWTNTPFIYGIFANHTNIDHAPWQETPDYSANTLLPLLKTKKITALFDGGKTPSAYPDIISAIIKSNPGLLTFTAKSSDYYQIQVYAIK